MTTFLEAMTAHEWAKKLCTKEGRPDLAAISSPQHRSAALDAAEKLEEVANQGERDCRCVEDFTELAEQAETWCRVKAQAWRSLIACFDTQRQSNDTPLRESVLVCLNEIEEWRQDAGPTESWDADCLRSLICSLNDAHEAVQPALDAIYRRQEKP